jgi:hypothetical protein
MSRTKTKTLTWKRDFRAAPSAASSAARASAASAAACRSLMLRSAPAFILRMVTSSLSRAATTSAACGAFKFSGFAIPKLHHSLLFIDFQLFKRCSTGAARVWVVQAVSSMPAMCCHMTKQGTVSSGHGHL